MSLTRAPKPFNKAPTKTWSRRNEMKKMIGHLQSSAICNCMNHEVSMYKGSGRVRMLSLWQTTLVVPQCVYLFLITSLPPSLTHTDTQTHRHTHTYTQTDTQTHSHIYIHTHTHTDTLTHTHTQTQYMRYYPYFHSDPCLRVMHILTAGPSPHVSSTNILKKPTMREVMKKEIEKKSTC